MSKQKIMAEINKITLEIEEKYPELYSHLGENPMTIPNDDDPNVVEKNLSEYLESLKVQVKHHVEKNASKP